jgi:hypothetical protein
MLVGQSQSHIKTTHRIHAELQHQTQANPSLRVLLMQKYAQTVALLVEKVLHANLRRAQFDNF